MAGRVGRVYRAGRAHGREGSALWGYSGAGISAGYAAGAVYFLAGSGFLPDGGV